MFRQGADRLVDLVIPDIGSSRRPPDVLAGDALAGIECPALILVGGEDKTFLRAAEVMQAKLGGRTECEILPGIGHVANLEDPEAFNARVIAFLDTL